MENAERLSAQAPDAPGFDNMPDMLGPYALGRYIGAGAFGRVFEAVDTRDAQLVAVKVLYAASQIAIERFQREIDISKGLQHENIVSVIDSGYEEGHYFLVMPLIKGANLRAHLVRRLPNCSDAAKIAVYIARACDHAHRCKPSIVHRDIKPDNILIENKTERVVVADFGLAKRLEVKKTLTTNQKTGTLHYMPPEQLDPRLGHLAPASDVYGIGATLYEMLTGLPPFPRRPGMPGPSIEYEVTWSAPRPLRQLNADIPDDLQTICLICLQKTPEDRYKSAALLADDLERFLAGQPIDGRLPGPLRRWQVFCRRRPRITATIAALFIAVLIAGGAAMFYARQAIVSKAIAVTRTIEAAQDRSTRQWDEYVASMQSVQSLYNKGELHRAQELLDRYITRTGEDFRGLEWYYWNYRLHHGGLRFSFPGCKAIALAPNGQYLAASDGQHIAVWDVRRQLQLFVRNAFDAPLPTEQRIAGQRPYIAFNSNGKLLACLSPVTLPDHRAAGCLRAWDLTGKELLSLRPDPSMPVLDINFEPNSGILVVNRTDPSSRKYDLYSSTPSLALANSQALHWVTPNPYDSPSDQTWLFDSSQGTLFARRGQQGLQLVCIRPGYSVFSELQQLDTTRIYTSLAKVDNPHIIAAAATDGTVHEWKIARFDLVQPWGDFKAISTSVNTLAISSSPGLIASGDPSGEILVQPESEDDTVHFPIDSRPIDAKTSDLFVSHDSRVVARFYREFSKLDFDASDGHHIATIAGHNLLITAVCFSPRGNFAAVAYGTAPDIDPTLPVPVTSNNTGGLDFTFKVCLIDLRTGQLLATFPTSRIIRDLELSFSDNDAKFAMPSDAGQVRLWDMVSKKAILLKPDSSPGSCLLSPSGAFVVISDSRQTEIIRTTDQKEIFHIDHPGTRFVFNPQENWLYFCAQYSSEWRSVVYDFLKQEELPNLFGIPVKGQFFFVADARRAYSLNGGKLNIYSTTDWSLITAIPVDVVNDHHYDAAALSKTINMLLDNWRSSGLERERDARKAAIPSRRFYAPQGSSFLPYNLHH